MLETHTDGLGKHHSAVVDFCMTLGKDSSSVLGHLDSSSISHVIKDEKYNHLGNSHAFGYWNNIDYCKGCDQLYDIPESLVRNNIKNRKYNQSKMI